MLSQKILYLIVNIACRIRGEYEYEYESDPMSVISVIFTMTFRLASWYCEQLAQWDNANLYPDYNLN